MATGLIKPPDVETEHTQSQGSAIMGFFDHLDELRIRVFRTVLSIGIGMALAIPFTNPVLNLIKDSYGDRMQVVDPTESVVIFFRIALFLGAVLASPMVTYQLFMFVLPGLTKNEKRWVFLALPATTALFFLGVVFTAKFLLPAYITFLQGFQNDIFRVDWRANSYIGFITGVLFWHAAAFETPLVFFVLGRIGAVTARGMLRYWRHAIVASSIIAAFISPTVDPFTMLIITLILISLYLLSVLLVALTSRIGHRRDAS